MTINFVIIVAYIKKYLKKIDIFFRYLVYLAILIRVMACKTLHIFYRKIS